MAKTPKPEKPRKSEKPESGEPESGKAEKPERSRPTRRTLVQVVAFLMLLGGAAFYLMKPNTDANRSGQATSSWTDRGKAERRAAVQRPGQKKPGQREPAAAPPAATAPQPTTSANGKAPPPQKTTASRKNRMSLKEAAAIHNGDKLGDRPPLRKPGMMLVPHQAQYLVRAFVIGVKQKHPAMTGPGELKYMLYCGEWTFQSNARLQPTITGLPATRAYMIIHRESEDGQRYRVNSRSWEGRTWYEATGRAKLGKDGVGEAFVEASTERRLIALPQGTVFPVTYLNRLLKAAMAGKTEFRSVAYGKSSPFLLLRVDARISPAKPKVTGRIPGLLRSKRVWRVDYTYRDANSPDRTHPFRTSIIINEYGVTLWTEMDYGRLRLVSTLANVDLVPRGPCRKKKRQ